MNLPKTWAPNTWRSLPTLQIPSYPHEASLQRVLDQLKNLPPLTFPGEIDQLRNQLTKAEQGNGFVLQGGDCAERFIDCTEESILNKFKILLQMSVVLTYSLRQPIIKIGRLAGQYGKPRSKPMEETKEGTVFSYFGDNVNSFIQDKHARIPDPQRLQDGYFYSAATLNWLRAMIKGGFTDLHHPHTWNLHAIAPAADIQQYNEVTHRILDAISFMESFGASKAEALGSTDFWTSHECLHLPFEESMVRVTNRDGNNSYYASSAHFLWLGERTRQIDHGHVEFLRGIQNPVGIKLGPSAKSDDVLRLAQRLNPKNEQGKIVFITRMGADKVESSLPPLLSAIKSSGTSGLWICDPMHGNTLTTADGTKTRHYDTVIKELEGTARAHKEVGTRLGGVHFELTGEDVTECLGGPGSITEGDLGLRYTTWCDPRLNYAQSLELAFRLRDIVYKNE